ncbi:hypothetical protein BOTBODRAFT_38049, partial [Botryobasidium botryosum FD-172 SS1]
MGCAVVIIAAKAFWLRPGAQTEAPEIRASSELYIQSQISEHVKLAILEAFQGVAGPYDTPWCTEVLEHVALSNQM